MGSFFLCVGPFPQTIPFPVVTDSLKVQVAMQIPSKWSKLFSFNKSHATILRLEGEVRVRHSKQTLQTISAAYILSLFL